MDVGDGGIEDWGISSLVTRGEITVTPSRWSGRERIFQVGGKA